MIDQAAYHGAIVTASIPIYNHVEVIRHEMTRYIYVLLNIQCSGFIADLCCIFRVPICQPLA